MINAGNSITATLVGTLNSIISFIPRFISGLVILLIGLLVASLARVVVKKGAQFFRVDVWLKRAHIESTQATDAWINVASQVVFWFILLSFLIPTFNAWQLPTITNILNQFVLYLPNVFAAVVIGFLGVVLGSLAYNVARDATRITGQNTSRVLGNVAKYSIIVFAILMALNQLNISPNLIEILLAGLVGMAALGGGLALGLGGRDTAHTLLDEMMQNREKLRSRASRRSIAYAQQIKRNKPKTP